MPFTFSHPLFAVPLRRLAPKWLSVTGLVLGSMSPDMEYFMAMQSYQTIGHTVRGFLLQGLPLSIAFAFAFHRVVKPVLPKFLPASGGLAHFVNDLTNEEWKLGSIRSWTIFFVSLFLGYWTHIFMDAWTHSTGVFVGKFTFLQGKYEGQRVYQLLQYLFSVIGLLIPGLMLLMRYYRWYGLTRKKRLANFVSPSERLRLWSVAISVGAALFAVKVSLSAGHEYWLKVLVVAPFSAGLFGIFAACLLHLAAQNHTRKKAAAALSLLLLSIVVFLCCEYLLPLKGVSDLTFHRLRTANFPSQTLWNGFLICWAVLVLWSCRLFSVKGKATRISRLVPRDTPPVS